MPTLRPYQEDAQDAIWRSLTETDDHGVVAIPTGGGKTVVFVSLIKRLLQYYPRTRVCILAHVRELLTQAEEKLFREWPLAPAGIWCSGLNRGTGRRGRAERRAQILIASIQTVHNKADQIEPFDLIIVDEAHLVPSRDESMYGRFLSACWKRNNDLRVIGFTATPYRLDGGLIYGEGKMFTSLIYQANIADLIRDGYLCRFSTKGPQAQIDTSGLHRRNGDFIESELEKAAEANVEEAVAELVALTKDRKSVLVFCAGVKHAEKVSGLLSHKGIGNEIVIGDTPSDKRTRTIHDFDSGRLRCVVNVGCLTTGLDVQRIDCIACLRPTESTSLWVQMVGRGGRLFPGKDDCLVLDFGGNALRHGPLDDLVVKSPGATGGEAPFKYCPKCGETCHASMSQCPCCGHVFPAREPNHDDKASTAPILSDDGEPWTETVSDVTLSIHQKKGSPDSLRISYRCGINTYNEWLCFGHTGFAKEKADRWWLRNSQLSHQAPGSAAEAMDRLTKSGSWGHAVAAIVVRRNGKYFDVVRIKMRKKGETLNA